VSHHLRRPRVTLVRTLCLLSALCTGWTLAQDCPDTDPDALAWLDRMAHSLNQVSYSGVVTLQRGEQMQVLQVSHLVEDGVATEKLLQLTGQGAEVVRMNHPLSCIHPGGRLLLQGDASQQDHCGIARNYRLSMADGDRIAGRQAVRILIQPRDMYRYGYVMDLDRETGLPLRTQTLGQDALVLEQFQFAKLSYGAEPAAETDVAVLHEATHPGPAPGQSEGGDPGGPPWQINWLPRGFTATDRPAPDGVRRTYTDGLAVFSVFLEHLGREIRSGEGVARNGATTSYTRGMHFAGGPVLVTVIGEVPVNTARMVADSVAGVP